MNLHKRSCCSTWVPQKINMEFAKDSRTIVFREEWPFADRGIYIDQPPYIYNYIYSYNVCTYKYIYIYGDVMFLWELYRNLLTKFVGCGGLAVRSARGYFELDRSGR